MQILWDIIVSIIVSSKSHSNSFGRNTCLLLNIGINPFHTYTLVKFTFKVIERKTLSLQILSDMIFQSDYFQSHFRTHTCEKSLLINSVRNNFLNLRNLELTQAKRKVRNMLMKSPLFVTINVNNIINYPTFKSMYDLITMGKPFLTISVILFYITRSWQKFQICFRFSWYKLSLYPTIKLKWYKLPTCLFFANNGKNII